MRVLIVGAGGRLGQLLVREALKQDHEVIALVRSAEQLCHLSATRLKVIEGDVLHPGKLDPSMAGQHAVICSLGVKATREKVTTLSEGTDNVIRAMKRHNVWRLLCITGIGAGNSRGHGGLLYDRVLQPWFLKSVYEDKDRQEALVAQSGRDWLIVRPARLTDTGPKRRFAVKHNVRGVTAGRIARADVAEWTVAQLSANKYLYRSVILTDDEGALR